MKFELNKSQRLAANAATKDESRLRKAKGNAASTLEGLALACVHIRKGFIEAANGYLLIRKNIDYRDDESILLKADKVAKCRDYLGTVVFETEENTDEVKATGEDILMLKAQQGDFLDVDKLYPYPINSTEVMDRLAGKEQKEVFKIAINRDILLTMLKCLDTDEQTIRFYFYGKENPVRFEVQGKANGLIMPMHVDW